MALGSTTVIRRKIVVDNRTDEQLARAAAKGDEAAEEALYRKYQGKLMGVFFRKGLRQECEDLTQEALVKIHRGLDGFDESKGPFCRWAFTIGMNVLTDWLRRRQTRRQVGALPRDPEGNEEEPVELLAQYEDWDELRSAISQLEERDRLLIEARLEGMTAREMQEDLFHDSISLDSARGRIHRAMVKLRECLKKCEDKG